jgi:hypothetical protein
VAFLGNICPNAIKTQQLCYVYIRAMYTEGFPVFMEIRHLMDTIDMGTLTWPLLNLFKENLSVVAGRRARGETESLCSDNEAGGRDGKAER